MEQLNSNFELGNMLCGDFYEHMSISSGHGGIHLVPSLQSIMVNCTYYLLSLADHTSASTFLSKIKFNAPLISGVPHGWVLEPHAGEAKALVSQQWNLFIFAGESSDQAITAIATDHAVSFVKGSVSIPQDQYDHLAATIGKPATPSEATPPLPDEWSDGQTGRIPHRHVLPAKSAGLEPGELKLYEPMAKYLSTTLPEAIRDKPVSLFNLFKYRNGDPSTHEHYMQGFKDEFGPAAGAQLKFMGPVSSQPTLVNSGSKEGTAMAWQDANIVQYDTIWHYAYMLSTEVYSRLNKEKVEGLEDTCILLISEIELQQ